MPDKDKLRVTKDTMLMHIRMTIAEHEAKVPQARRKLSKRELEELGNQEVAVLHI
jgi:hypothetical protein